MTKFREDRKKIVDFLLIVTFLASLEKKYSPSISPLSPRSGAAAIAARRRRRENPLFFLCSVIIVITASTNLKSSHCIRAL